MEPGWSGVEDVDTLNVRALLVPHELVAVTETVPPLASGVAVIDVDVELPPHPEGKDHV